MKYWNRLGWKYLRKYEARKLWAKEQQEKMKEQQSMDMYFTE